MATVDLPSSKKKRVRRTKVDRPKRKRGRPFLYGSLVMFLLLAVTVYAAPVIVAHTTLAQKLLAWSLRVDGTVSLRSASLGWFSEVIVDDIEIRDPDGEAVLTVATIRTERTLASLLANLHDIGRVYVDRPALHVIAYERGTNLEDVFAALINTESTTENPTLQLIITSGTIKLDDAATNRSFILEKVDLDGHLANTSDTIALVASGELPNDDRPGTFKLDLRTKGNGQADSTLANGKLDCRLRHVPLGVIEPLLRRYVDKAQLSGQLSAELGGAWGDMATGGDASLNGQAEIENLALSAAVLDRDVIKMDRVDLPCRLVQHDDTVNIEQLGLDCPLASLAMTGGFRLSDLSAVDKLAALVRENYQVKGQLDLAGLAAQLPNALRLHEATKITSGQVSLDVASERTPDKMRWHGTLQTTHLAGQAQGRTIDWKNPLSITFDTHEAKDGLTVDRVECQSEFLTVDGTGTVDEFQMAANFDLARLMHQLQQFSDLNGLQLAGAGRAQMQWKRTADNKFASEGQFQARGFQIVFAGGQPWKEDNVSATWELAGLLADNKLRSIESASLEAETAADRLTAQLQSPITNPSTAAWPIHCTWQGQLNHWAPRLETCLGLTGWEFNGAGKIEASAKCTTALIDELQLKLDVSRVLMRGHGWYISEPTLTANVSGRADLAKSHVELATSNVALGNSLATLNRAVLAAGSAGWSLDNLSAQLSADLTSLYRWRQDPRVPPLWQVSGRLAAQADLKYAGGVTSGSIDGNIEQLQLVDLSHPARPGAAPPVWRESKITLAARGTLEQEHSLLKFEKLQLASAGIACDARGQLPLADTGGDLELQGAVQYDWEQLGPLWHHYVGANVQVSGRQKRDFHLAGRLTGSPSMPDSWRQVSGDMSLGWIEIDLAGVQVGPGDIVAHMADGQVRIQPINLIVSDGKFTANPFVRLSPGPAEMLLPRGPLLTNVHLSPQLCSRGLKYLAPVLADTTVADGTFSVTLDGGRIPLADPTLGDVAGQMAIRAQVRSGPLANQFLMILSELTTLLKRGTFDRLTDQSGSLLSIDDSNVEFRMVGSRVYHRGLTFKIGTTPITTHGSVGLDESLAMVAEVPVQAKLLGIDLSLGTLEGQTMQIPIEGTLGKPKFDRGIVQQFAGKFIQNAARGVLVDEVGKQLDRLIPKP